MPDEDDRSREGSSAADAPRSSQWADVVVPDDISALAGDVAAYHRELRSRRRQARIQRLRRHQRTLPLLITGTALVVAAIVVSLLTFLTGGTVSRGLASAPIAHPAQPAGSVGGLLPKVFLSPPHSSQTVSSQAGALRPSVFALVEPGCNCRDRLNQLDGSANQVGLDLNIVVTGTDDSYFTAFAQAQVRGKVNVYDDRAGRLATAVQARGITAIVVGSDGRIVAMVPAVDSGSIIRLIDPAVSQLSALPAASTG